MPRDGSGNYTLPSGNPVVTNTIISSNGWANPTLSDIASAITQSLSRDGQTTPTANLTMGNFRLTNLGDGTARSDAVNVGQIQDNQLVALSSIGGTGDAITASTSPAVTSYMTGSKWVYTPTNANTISNPTINIDGLGAKTITQSNGAGLWSGALVVGTPYELAYDGTNFRVQSGALASLVQVIGSRTSHRNYFADGNFDFWRCGSSITYSGNTFGYTADMWLCGSGSGASASVTVTPVAFAAGAEPAGMTTPVRNALSFQQTVASTAVGGFISQHIESVATLENRTATFSLWLWTNSGSISISTINVVQNFGTGGSVAVTTPISVAWTVTTTPQRFSVSIPIPSISGKTIGTSGDFLAVTVLMPVSVTFQAFTGQWQLEESPAGAPATGLPTPFEFRGYDAELARVNRYVQLLGDTSISSLQALGTGVYTTTTNFAALVALVNTMRAQPSLTFLSGSASALLVAGPASLPVSAIAIATAASSNTELFVNATVAGATTGQGGILRFTSSGRLIADARL